MRLGDPLAQAQVIEAIAGGQTMAQAAAVVGVARITITRYAAHSPEFRARLGAARVAALARARRGSVSCCPR